MTLPEDYAQALSTLGKGGWCHEVGLLDPHNCEVGSPSTAR